MFLPDACENGEVRKKSTKRSLLAPLLPRGKRERRRVELLGGAAVGVFALLIASVFLLSSSQTRLLGSPQVAAVVSSVLIELANGDRAANSLETLKLNPVLVAAAQAKANDMATYGYFAHVSPQGVEPWHWFKEAGYTFRYAGENLAIDFSDSGDVERAWMNSPKHRQNILDPRFTEIGIATAQGMYQGRLTTFVVQEFGTPASATAKQEVVQTATVPSTPTQPAIATTEVTPEADTQVLGTVAKEPAKVAVQKIAKKADAPVTVATTSPAVAAVLAQDVAEHRPFWAYAISFPRDTLRYAFYAIGLLVLLALMVETGLEIRWHHRTKAIRAGVLLAAMCLLFVAADSLFFAQPVLAAQEGLKAAVSLAL